MASDIVEMQVGNTPEWLRQWGYRKGGQLVGGDDCLYIKVKVGDLQLVLATDRDRDDQTVIRFATLDNEQPGCYRVRPGLLIRGEQGNTDMHGLYYYPEPDAAEQIKAFIVTCYDSKTKNVSPLIDYLKDNAHPVVRTLLECALTQEKL